MSYEAASALVASMESGTGHAILKPPETRVSMFRAARLIADDIASPAVIRNLSAGGAMGEAEAPLKLGMEVRLALPNFSALEGDVGWIMGAAQGILFNEKIRIGEGKN